MVVSPEKATELINQVPPGARLVLAECPGSPTQEPGHRYVARIQGTSSPDLFWIQSVTAKQLFGLNRVDVSRSSAFFCPECCAEKNLEDCPTTPIID